MDSSSSTVSIHWILQKDVYINNKTANLTFEATGGQREKEKEKLALQIDKQLNGHIEI